MKYKKNNGNKNGLTTSISEGKNTIKIIVLINNTSASANLKNNLLILSPYIIITKKEMVYNMGFIYYNMVRKQEGDMYA
jgi:hypothetical protein